MRMAVGTTGRPSPPLPPPLACRSKNCCYYQCVHCLSPVSSLYRQYGGGSSSSSSTLKLSVCQACGDNVDPYVEREWLLVVLDMVLLREEAYRHVLLNNRLVDLEDSSQSSSSSLLQYLLASSVLQAYLLWEALLSSSSSSLPQDQVLLQHNRTNYTTLSSNEDLQSIAWEFSRLVFISLLDHCVLAMTCLVVLVVCLLPQQQQQKQRAPPLLPWKTIATRIYIGILLPTTFSFVTILALCWENTDTVRMLGGFMIRCFQIMALQTTALAALVAAAVTTTTESDDDIVKKKKKNDDDDDDVDSKLSSLLLSSTSSSSSATTCSTAYFRLKALVPVAIGMMTRITVGAVIGTSIQKGERENGIPCTGFMYDFHGTIVCLS